MTIPATLTITNLRPFFLPISVLTLFHSTLTATGSSYISGRKTARMYWDVRIFQLHKMLFYLITFEDNEFTQLMKGLQGERLRQAFKYLDKDEDGFIRPEEFKRIILVCCCLIRISRALLTTIRKFLVTNYPMLLLTDSLRSAL